MDTTTPETMSQPTDTDPTPAIPSPPAIPDPPDVTPDTMSQPRDSGGSIDADPAMDAESVRRRLEGSRVTSSS